MKKTLLAAALLLGALTVSAQDYKHSIGATVGSMYGVSYKGFLTEHIAIQADLGVNLYGGTKYSGSTGYKYSGDGVDKFNQTAPAWAQLETSWQTTSGTFDGTYGGFTFELNPNVVYQAKIKDFDWGGISWFAGGGVSLGLMKDTKYHNSWGNWSLSYSGDHSNGVRGKFGINAIGGAEIKLNSLPLAFSLDFRPGYGMQFDQYAEDVKGMDDAKYNYRSILNFFDWKLVASVRYCF